MALLNVKQAALRAGVSRSLVYEWCEQKLLTHYRLGGEGKRGKVMIDEKDLDEFLASCRKEADPEPPPPPLKHIKL